MAGVGNIFLGDDGFGVEVVGRLRQENLPPEVEVADFGIRSLHLAYELLDGRFDTAILVDTVQRGGAPGTVYLIEPEAEAKTAEGQAEAVASGMGSGLADAHGTSPDTVFRLLAALGGRPPRRVLVIGCEPATIEDTIGLSEPVERSVDEAVRWILDLL